MLTYVSLRVLGFLVPLLPGWFGRRLAIFMGDICYLSQPAARLAVDANLRRVVGDSARRRPMVRHVFRTQALNYFDLFRIPRLPMTELDTIVKTKGWEHFEESLAAGRGAIAVVPHVGNLDVVAQTPISKSVPVTIPVEVIKPPRLLKLITNLRACRGVTIVPLDGSPGAARAIYGALKRNELVGIVADRDVLGTGLRVRFFGEYAKIPSGPAALALRTGATLHAACAFRRADGTYELEVTPPLQLTRTGNYERDVEAATEAAVAELEHFIRRAPEQWVVFEPIWRAGEAGESTSGPVKLRGRVKGRWAGG